jgi:hypothetical protein
MGINTRFGEVYGLQIKQSGDRITTVVYNRAEVRCDGSLRPEDLTLILQTERLGDLFIHNPTLMGFSVEAMLATLNQVEAGVAVTIHVTYPPEKVGDMHARWKMMLKALPRDMDHFPWVLSASSEGVTVWRKAVRGVIV